MTVIAWDGVSLAADRQMTVGSVKAYQRTKIGRFEDALYAISGNSSVGQELLHWWKAGADPEKFPQSNYNREYPTRLHVILPNKEVECYEAGPYPIPFEGRFYAAGLGHEVAMGLMLYGHTAKEAAEAACQVVEGCGGDVDVLTLNP